MAKATWTTRPGELAAAARDDGAFEAIVPLYDDNVKQGQLRFVMTEDRELTVYWEQLEGTEGLADFRAWWTEI